MIEASRRPTYILVGAFPHDYQLRAAQKALEEHGLSRDFIGTAISEGASLLSVLVPRGQEDEIASVLARCGATMVGEPAELEPHYGPTPHPGAWEDHDLKIPSREYPAVAQYPERVPTRNLDPRERIYRFDEVDLGYSLEEALAEASRCVQCPRPFCVEGAPGWGVGCPVRNDIPGFIKALREGDFARGIEILRRTSSLPGICGRVCDKARQCEGACLLRQEGAAPVAIGALERFLADGELAEGRRNQPAESRAPPTGKRVAVVGSGPSGLAAAGDLALSGHQVTIYEALPVPGGALAWGIPTFRLPQHVVEAEIDYLLALGVEFKLNTKVGKDITIDDLFAQGYDAVFIGAGAAVSTTMGVPGESLAGVYTATEFLSRAKLARIAPGLYAPPEVGKRLAVIGAGNTAMDVAQTALRLDAVSDIAEAAMRLEAGIDVAEAALRLEAGMELTDVAETARRLGVEEVTVVYRRSEAEMPARREEVETAREEGVRFQFLAAPVRFIGSEEGRVAAMECIQMELGRPDARGRRQPIPKPGSELVVPVDTVVLALGYRPEPTVVRTTPGLAADQAGLIVADPQTGRASRQGVWAGGDIAIGPDTVVRAMGAGKLAAQDIDRYLRGQSSGRAQPAN